MLNQYPTNTTPKKEVTKPDGIIEILERDEIINIAALCYLDLIHKSKVPMATLAGFANNYEISKLFALSNLDFSTNRVCPNPLESYMRIPLDERAILDNEIRGKLKEVLMNKSQGLDILVNAEQRRPVRP